jgi:hypothetical protein
MIERFAELNSRWIVLVLLAGIFAQIANFPTNITPPDQLPNCEAFLVETGFASNQPDRSSDSAIVGAISRKCHLVIVSSSFRGMVKEILAPFQIPLLETGRGLGGCGEN